MDKDLIKSAPKLTRQGIQNQRARLANLSSQCGLILEGVISGIVTCPQCNTEHAPKVDKVTLDTIKLVYSKTLPDITPEDMDSVTDEPKSRDDLMRSLSTMVIDRPILTQLAQSHPQAAMTCRDTLIELLSGIDQIGKPATVTNQATASSVQVA